MDADPLIMVLTVTSVAFVSSTLTALVGAGGGTGLLLVMLWFVPAASVVPVHGCIQLVSNTARVVLFRRHMHWPAIIRFVIPMPAGVYVGLQLHGMMSQAALQLVIAGFVLLSLLVRVPDTAAGRGFPSWAYVPVGFLIGGANVLVGVLSPILGAILRFERLDKERMVGTLGFFGFAGNVFKVAGFALVGFSFADYLPMIACASVAAILGNVVGRRLLGGISSPGFARAFRVMLGLLALKLVWDALSGLL